jgi:hypothetical protein
MIQPVIKNVYYTHSINTDMQMHGLVAHTHTIGGGTGGREGGGAKSKTSDITK